MLYSMDCGDPARGCRVDVSDSRIALLTTSLTTPPISLDSLAAFDLATGKILWQGITGSKLAVQSEGSCTAIAAPHKDLWFACTCTPAASAPAPPGSPSNDTGGMGSDVGGGDARGIERVTPVTTDATDSEGAAILTTADATGQNEVKGTVHRRRRPDDDDVGRTGLCAYAVSSTSGKLLSEVRRL